MPLTVSRRVSESAQLDFDTSQAMKHDNELWPVTVTRTGLMPISKSRLGLRAAFRSMSARLIAVLTLCAALVAPATAFADGNVVISQVYGGGGDAGSTLRYDFVELFNRTSGPLSLAGASVQYGSSDGVFLGSVALSGTIQAGGYYLVKLGGGGGGTMDLPVADATGFFNIDANSGVVALVASTTLASSCHAPSVVDIVGYGSSTLCTEGLPAPGLTITTSAFRNGGGCQDLDHNSLDFSTGGPDPFNSASAINLCSAPPTCTYTLSAASASAQANGGSATVSVTTGAGCTWSASSNAVFVTTTGGESGSGNGTVSYLVAANAANTERTGTLTIAGLTFTITQAAAAVVAPTVSLDRNMLIFAAASTGAAFTAKTAAQNVRLSQLGAGTVTWTASATQPWVTVTPSSGIGSATLTVGVGFVPALPSSGSTAATINIVTTGASNSLPSINVTLNLRAISTVPIGTMDTPSDFATGITGSVAVTGWALDDIEVTEVQIWRDPHHSDPAGAIFPGPPPQGGKVFVGYGSFVEGARPDVQVANPDIPLNSRAGWGYLMLTRGLIWDGQGPFKLYAIAADRDGHLTQIGSKTISIDNATATKPFGAIDTPGQGATASGMYPNTGWVLTPNAGATISAADVQVAVDGVFLPGVPSVSDRTDITGGFQTFNTIGAGRGLFIDTTAFANGVHTIGWLVTDSIGKADGVGSRFFTVANGALMAEGVAVAAPLTEQVPARSSSPTAVQGRRGFDQQAPYATLPTEGGSPAIHAEELDRVEIRLGDLQPDGWSGFLRVGAMLEPLPIGSHLAGGTFTWQLGPGFLGVYELVFVRSEGGATVDRQDVRITIHPQGTFTRPQVVIDTPAAGELVTGAITIGGWALDPETRAGSIGISSVHAWAYPVRGGSPIFVGSGTTGGSRPDVASIYGSRFQGSGFGISGTVLPRGTYNLAVFAWCDALGGFLPAKVVQITVR
jgi:Lamin Tail Domain/Viral BACON domain